MANFNPYNVLLATNIPQRLKTGFVLQAICDPQMLNSHLKYKNKKIL